MMVLVLLFITMAHAEDINQIPDIVTKTQERVEKIGVGLAPCPECDGVYFEIDSDFNYKRKKCLKEVCPNFSSSKEKGFNELAETDLKKIVNSNHVKKILDSLLDMSIREAEDKKKIVEASQQIKQKPEYAKHSLMKTLASFEVFRGILTAVQNDYTLETDSRFLKIKEPDFTELYNIAISSNIPQADEYVRSVHGAGKKKELQMFMFAKESGAPMAYKFLYPDLDYQTAVTRDISNLKSIFKEIVKNKDGLMLMKSFGFSESFETSRPFNQLIRGQPVDELIGQSIAISGHNIRLVQEFLKNKNLRVDHDDYLEIKAKEILGILSDEQKIKEEERIKRMVESGFPNFPDYTPEEQLQQIQQFINELKFLKNKTSGFSGSDIFKAAINDFNEDGKAASGDLGLIGACLTKILTNSAALPSKEELKSFDKIKSQWQIKITQAVNKTFSSQTSRALNKELVQISVFPPMSKEEYLQSVTDSMKSNFNLLKDLSGVERSIQAVGYEQMHDKGGAARIYITQKFCGSLPRQTVRDHTMQGLDAVILSGEAMKVNKYGLDIYAHEFGHQIAHLLKSGKGMSEKSLLHFKHTKNCLRKIHPPLKDLVDLYAPAKASDELREEFAKNLGEDPYFEEDFADYFLAQVNKVNRLQDNFFCHVIKRTEYNKSVTEENVDSFYDKPLAINAKNGDSHSSSFVRALNVWTQATGELPKSCRDLLPKNREIKSCGTTN